tara:strand:- start:43 stop:657 length:615 start_codon:yes stop_codon:yes gene_type:complete
VGEREVSKMSSGLACSTLFNSSPLPSSTRLFYSSSRLLYSSSRPLYPLLLCSSTLFVSSTLQLVTTTLFFSALLPSSSRLLYHSSSLLLSSLLLVNLDKLVYGFSQPTDIIKRNKHMYKFKRNIYRENRRSLFLSWKMSTNLLQSEGEYEVSMCVGERETEQQPVEPQHNALHDSRRRVTIEAKHDDQLHSVPCEITLYGYIVM